MNPLTLFSGPYALLAKWGVIALLALSLLTFGWVKGNEHGTQKLTDYQGKQLIEEVRVAKARDVVTTEVKLKYIKVKGDAEVVTKTVEKEVIKYAEVNTTSCLDPEWRRLHDVSALGKAAVPTATSGVDGTGGAPKAAEAISTVTENYGAANRNADKLEALQEWIRKQTKVK